MSIIKCSTCAHRRVSYDGRAKGKGIKTVMYCAKKLDYINHKGNKNKTQCPEYEEVTDENRDPHQQPWLHRNRTERIEMK